MKSNQDRPEHPYVNFEGTSLWRAVDRAIADLEQNQDIKPTELREYVVGYICKQLKRRGLVQQSAIEVKGRRRTIR